MINCPACSAPVPAGGRFCPQCGSSLDSGDAITRLGHVDKGKSFGSLSSLDVSSVTESRFVPGDVIAQRYRIYGLLGKGGMGEVYRADDLKLEQSVALKFLPLHLATDPARLARFRAEVRLARQVSHPNVCRVYDLGEVEGQQFLSMEYVGGEDLRSLLRKIGRFPEDRALDIARQSCAGLAAAHNQGVLHRDLKPANIMLDVHGVVRIMDFGLASLADDQMSAEMRSGTPAYMAPEQLEGHGATRSSDIFSLGLVLFEVFTGKRFFVARNLPELVQLQKSLVSDRSSYSDSLPPEVERVVLRCLDPDPERRPRSALAVATALPGGDPLQAALEAGETPSPEIVAAASAEGTLSTSLAVTCLVTVLIGVVVVLLLAERSLWERIPTELSVDVLANRAREISADLGYEAYTDDAWGFTRNRELLDHIEIENQRPDRWDFLSGGRPSGVLFWYRRSPQPLASWLSFRPDYTDPPATVSGMVSLQLDTRGRLTEFMAVPGRTETSIPSAGSIDWSALFVLAGLESDRFEISDSTSIPPVFADAHRTWRGSYSEQPETEVRIEAGVLQGRLVYFKVFEPWTTDSRFSPPSRTLGQRVAMALGISILVLCVAFGLLLARRNLRKGRGDPRGAMRVASFFVVTGVVGLLLSTHYVGDLYEGFRILISSFSRIVFGGAVVWVVYLALEPSLRRRWPQGVIGWSRLLAGEFTDPLIGRDLLVGTACGALIAVLAGLDDWLAPALGAPPPVPGWFNGDNLLGGRIFLGGFLETVVSAVEAGLSVFFLLMLLRWLVRRDWLASLVVLALVVFQNVAAYQRFDQTFLVTLTLMSLIIYLLMFLLLRFGLLAGIVGFWAANTLLGNPHPLSLSVWYAPPGLFSAFALLAAAGVGFYLAVDRTRLFHFDLD